MLRVALIAAHPGADTPYDERDYETLALNLLHGDGYAIVPGSPTVERAPGYPFYLAGVFALFGFDLVAAQAASTLMGLLAVAGTWLLARRLAGDLAAALAALAVALDPYQARYATSILSEALFTAALVAVFLLLLRAVDRRRGRDWLLVGLMLGAAATIRPAALYAGAAIVLAPALLAIAAPRPSPSPSPAVALDATGVRSSPSSARTALPRAFLTSMPRPLLASLLVALSVSVTVVPWTVRNYVQMHHLVVVGTAYRGLNLYTASVQRYDGAWPGLSVNEASRAPVLATVPPPAADLPTAVRADVERQIRNGAWPTADDALARAALANALADPLGYLRLCALNFWRTWLIPEGAGAAAARLGRDAATQRLLFLALGLPQIALVVATGLLGAWRLRGQPAARVFVAFGAMYVLLHSIVPGHPRLRVPLEPLVFTFCAAGAARLVAAARRASPAWRWPTFQADAPASLGRGSR